MSIEDRAQEELRERHAPAFVRVAADLMTNHPPPRYVIDRLVPRGVVTLLGAHGGAGKSVLGLTFAAHVACGRTWAGQGIDRGRAVIVTLEDPASLVNFRLQRIVEAYALDANDVAGNVVILDGTESGAALAGETREGGVTTLGHTAAMEELRDAAHGATLIIVDNASDGFDANENDRRMVRAFVRRLASIARENNSGLILLAHIDKMAARHGGAGNTYTGRPGTTRRAHA